MNQYNVHFDCNNNGARPSYPLFKLFTGILPVNLYTCTLVLNNDVYGF